METPPFFWLGADAIADFNDWQTAEQQAFDAALIAAANCPVLEDEGE